MDIRAFAGKDYKGVIDPERLVARMEELLKDIDERGTVVQDGKKVVTGYDYGELYDWDLYFEMLFLSYFDEARYCRSGVEMFLERQHESGFVARTIGNKFLKNRHQFKPFLAQTALLGSRQIGDYRWLKWRFYEGLKKSVDYWFWYCDADKNGLCFWDGSDHSGMDDQRLRLGYDGVMLYEGADLNVYLVRELQAMSELATELGKVEDAAEFDQRAKTLTQKIHDVLWHEEDGFYYDRNEKTGELNHIKSIAGLLPLWLDDIPAERAERLVREHLMNEEEFWTPYPVATWAKNEPGYFQQRTRPNCTWMGSTWIPTNYMVFQGLMKHGFKKEAKMLAEKTYELVISESTTREYYNGETGSGQGLYPFWGWSSLGYLMLLECELDYSPSRIKQKEFKTIDLNG